MRVFWLAAPLAFAALAFAQPRALPGSSERPCCDLWIYEAANGPDSYAIGVKQSGETFVVRPAGSGAQVLDGAAAREALQRWIAIGRLAQSTTIQLDGRESRFSADSGGLDVDVVDPPSAPANDDAHTLIHIRDASSAQTRTFLKDVPHMGAEARTRILSALEAK